MPPLVSIVLGSYNRFPFLQAALASIRAEVANISHEIIIVEGGSDDGSLPWLLEQKDIITIVQHNRGTWQGKPIVRRPWAYFMNLAFKVAQGKYILMLSDDCIVIPQAIQNGIQYFEQSTTEERKIGAVAFYWREYPQQANYHVFFTNRKMIVNHGLYLRELVEQVGWLDETSFHFYHADSDLCLKIWHAGYEVVACPTAFIEHYPFTVKEVRAGNLATEKLDAQVLSQRWDPIFGKGLDSLDAEYVDYTDSYNTAHQFDQIVETIRRKAYLKTMVKKFLTRLGLIST